MKILSHLHSNKSSVPASNTYAKKRYGNAAHIKIAHRNDIDGLPAPTEHVFLTSIQTEGGNSPVSPINNRPTLIIRLLWPKKRNVTYPQGSRNPVVREERGSRYSMESD